MPVLAVTILTWMQTSQPLLMVPVQLLSVKEVRAVRSIDPVPQETSQNEGASSIMQPICTLVVK